MAQNDSVWLEDLELTPAHAAKLVAGTTGVAGSTQEPGAGKKPGDRRKPRSFYGL